MKALFDVSILWPKKEITPERVELQQVRNTSTMAQLSFQFS